MNLKVHLPEFAEDTIIHFIRDFAGERGVVIGLSGGLDSSVVLKLCTMAIGHERVLAVHMPDNVTPDSETEDAYTIAKQMGVEYREINIDKVTDVLRGYINTDDFSVLGNIKARARMLILYGIANSESRLVAGTSNKSELLTGYFTKYGDGASDFAPIGDLYKTQVRELAKRIGIPEKIIGKKPSANLVPGQYDEDELGMDYEMIDMILYGIEMNLTRESIVKSMNVDMLAVERIFKLYEKSRHKRVLLYIPKIGLRTVNTDWRE